MTPYGIIGVKPWRFNQSYMYGDTATPSDIHVHYTHCKTWHGNHMLYEVYGSLSLGVVPLTLAELYTAVLSV